MFIKSCVKASPCFPHIRLIAVGTWDLYDAARGTKWIPQGCTNSFWRVVWRDHDRCYVMSAKLLVAFSAMPSKGVCLGFAPY